MTVLNSLTGVIKNEYVQQARARGQKIVGYACLATPREVLDAAGLFPYRLKALGKGETEMADAYLSRFNCGFCRSCLQLGLDGTYDFLDGIIETNGCDHLRGMFENWQYAAPRSFFHYVRVPHLADADSMRWFVEEIELLIEALNEHFGADVNDYKLNKAIEIQDQIAAKMRRIYESRWGGEIKVSGHEIMSLMVAEGSLPAPDFVKLLDGFIGTLEDRKPINCRARLFMGGAATDEIGLIAELEQLGGLMVADSFCFGGRLFLREAVAKAPVHRLAEIYLNNLMCPRMFMNYPQRKAFILEMIEKAAVDGAVLFHNKFCDLHGIENVKLKMNLEEAGLPVLLLEKEYGAGADIGRLKTRVQAFLERLKR
ncbi:MAG: 2-hydroxyacyl-CoA dehydratase family protein [Bacillota bacterium]